tara:strand:+ start:3931 stop:4212 length:282 start_codon:yes stop_codon:yes gene_type:complete
MKNKKSKSVEHAHDKNTNHSHVDGDKPHTHDKPVKKTVVEKPTVAKVERFTDIIKTWNTIGLVLHEKNYSEYEATNIYIILEDALKKIKLADK